VLPLYQSVALTVVSIVVVVAFVCIKQEMVNQQPESVDTATAEMASQVEELGMERSVTQRILLSYCVVLSTVGDMRVRGPALLREVTGMAEVVSGGTSVGFYFIKCATGWDFYGRLWGGILTPPFLLFLTAQYTLLRGLWSSRDNRSSTTFLVGCFVMIVFLTYSSQTKNFLLGNSAITCICLRLILVMSLPPVFNCFGPVADEFFLRSDMSIECFEGGHVNAMVISGVVGVLWALAAPAAVTWMGRWRQGTHTDPRFRFLFGGFITDTCSVKSLITSYCRGLQEPISMVGSGGDGSKISHSSCSSVCPGPCHPRY
jgi:hypothetical protein